MLMIRMVYTNVLSFFRVLNDCLSCLKLLRKVEFVCLLFYHCHFLLLFCIFIYRNLSNLFHFFFVQTLRSIIFTFNSLSCTPRTINICFLPLTLANNICIIIHRLISCRFFSSTNLFPLFFNPILAIYYHCYYTACSYLSVHIIYILKICQV